MGRGIIIITRLQGGDSKDTMVDVHSMLTCFGINAPSLPSDPLLIWGEVSLGEVCLPLGKGEGDTFECIDLITLSHKNYTVCNIKSLAPSTFSPSPGRELPLIFQFIVHFAYPNDLVVVDLYYLSTSLHIHWRLHFYDSTVERVACYTLHFDSQQDRTLTQRKSTIPHKIKSLKCTVRNRYSMRPSVYEIYRHKPDRHITMTLYQIMPRGYATG